MVRYKGFTIYSLGLKRYKIEVGRLSIYGKTTDIINVITITSPFDGGLAEILALIDEIDKDL